MTLVIFVLLDLMRNKSGSVKNFKHRSSELLLWLLFLFLTPPAGKVGKVVPIDAGKATDSS